MDVTVNIKPTPAEARQLMGLPDVEPLQVAVLAKVEQRIMEQAEKLSADGLLNTWFASGTGAIDIFRGMARGVLSQGATRDQVAAEPKAASRE
jgi:hypothetical protein